MQQIMDSLRITVLLPGRIGGPEKHTNRQRHSVAVSEEFGSVVTKVILHNDRKEKDACRIFTVPGKYVKTWTKTDEVPYWEDPKRWAKLSEKDRIESHIARFDEGYGVLYEPLGDR